MEILQSKQDDILIVELNGRLDTTNYRDAEQKLIDLIDNQNEKKILIACDKLTYISSSGLRVMVMMLKKLKASGGQLVLSNLNENIVEIFEISGFTSIFEIGETREHAYSLFK